MAPSIWQLLIILGIVILVFGTKRLKSLGSDVGDAIKNFRQAMKEGEEAPKSAPSLEKQPAETTYTAHKTDYTVQPNVKDKTS